MGSDYRVLICEPRQLHRLKQGSEFMPSQRLLSGRNQIGRNAGFENVA